MKFNVFFMLRGPARTAEAPNANNPVEATSLAGLLAALSANLPDFSKGQLDIELVGVRIAPSLEEKQKIQVVSEGQLKQMLPGFNTRGAETRRSKV